ncbi:MULTISPECIES: hypothetical protein [Natrialbaceae]|uniref:hypothetical protein n=1 Tax=Natrialbaceae TaxID=1644061 RepID=UPI0031F32C3F
MKTGSTVRYYGRKLWRRLAHYAAKRRHGYRDYGSLETPNGLGMRQRPFSLGEVRPFFVLHRDYHFHVCPWNSFVYANGLERYGFDRKAQQEVDRIERVTEPYGNFLQVLTLEGEPYVKRGYATAEDFTVTAALCVEYTGSQR